MTKPQTPRKRFPRRPNPQYANGGRRAKGYRVEHVVIVRSPSVEELRDAQSLLWEAIRASEPRRGAA